MRRPAGTSGLGLMRLMGLMGLLSTALGQADTQPGVLVFCDDPSMERAALGALEKFNERIISGYKLALFQLLKARKVDNGSDSVYFLHFNSKISDCPAGGNKPSKACSYLPGAVLVECNATVHMTETETHVKEVDCKMDPAIVPVKAYCLGCPETIDENSEEVKSPMLASLASYNSGSNSQFLFTLNTIDSATRQVVAGLRFQLRFDLVKTICGKDANAELGEHCRANAEDPEYVNCNSTVDVAPWRHEPPQVNMECEPGLLAPTFLARRRPPGWSPLRHILFRRPSTTPPPTAPPPTPPKESSEEDTAALAANAKASDDLFHCPSKPWINDLAGGGPTSSAAAGGFQDLDLLGALPDGTSS